MRAKTKVLRISILLMLAGCSSYAPEPLTINHPAYPGAPASALTPRSQTLAYAAADLPSASVTRAAADSGGHDAHHAPAANAPKTASGEGSVIAVVPATGQLVIQHGEIKDFMDAMTMGYPTEPASLLEGLKAGDKIRFSIDTEKEVIVKVEKLN